MSHYTSIELSITNREALIEALIECGVPRSAIEVHDTPQRLKDYRGQTTRYRFKDFQDQRFKDGDCAHVIIRKEHFGGIENDAGIYLDGEKSVFLLDDYTRSKMHPFFKNLSGAQVTGEVWLKDVRKAYVYHQTKAQYSKKGKKVEKKLGQDGRLHIFVGA